MLSALAVSGYTLPLPTLTAEAASRPGRTQTDILTRLAKLSAAQAKARVELKEQRDRFDALYDEARQLAASPDELRELAKALRVRELEAAAVLVPQIERLRQNLASPKGNADTPTIRSWRRLAEESLEIAITWLELYQNLQIRLLKLASDQLNENEPGSPIFSDADAAAEYLRKLVAT
jgi:hypothetical protein